MMLRIWLLLFCSVAHGLVCSVAHGATVMRIACGSPVNGNDAHGNVWQADAYFAGGAAFTNPALAVLDWPFRTLRYTPATMVYTLPIPNGAYTLTLSFIENRTAALGGGVGLRKFSASVTGDGLTIGIVASNLDLYAVAGPLTPWTVTVPVGVFNGKAVITVTANLGNALLSGIQVDTVEEPPPAPGLPHLTGLEAAPPACPPVGLWLFLATDTQHLFWCADGGGWTRVGNFDAGPLLFNHPAKLEACTGSGLSFNEDGSPALDPKTGLQMRWDCAKLYRATVRLADGSLLPVVGGTMDLPAGPAVWVIKQ